MVDKKLVSMASAISISEAQPNDIYMTVRMRMCSTRTNLNGVAVTEAFIDSIVSNADKYTCIPLCADVNKLKVKDYSGQGHMYDPKTQMFYTQQIGGFYAFERIDDEYGVSLIGEARIAKRNQKICNAQAELFAEGKLNFSWEILAGEYEERDGVTIIDASEKNHLIGMAVVSVPAYPEAKAFDLVAELDEMKAMEQMFKHTVMRHVFSEVSLQTVYQWVYDALKEIFPEYWYQFCIERVCADCFIAYDSVTAKTYKVDFMVTDDGLVVIDGYEVVYARKESEMVKEIEMVEAEKMEEEIVEVSEAEVEVSETEEESVEMSEAEEAEVDAEVTEAEAEVEALEAEAEFVEVEIAKAEAEPVEEQVNPFQAELDRANERIRELEENEAKRELEENRKVLKAFAQRMKMDMDNESVKEAIEEGSYEKIVKLSSAMTPSNPFMSTITAKSRYSLLEKN